MSDPAKSHRPAYGETDTGRKRRRNEDSFVCEPPLFAVADGMGGAQAGEIASALAADALASETEASGGGEERVDGADPGGEPARAPTRVDDAAASGMGTTMTRRARRRRTARSRSATSATRARTCLRDDRLEQLTNDHSLVAELVRRGELSPQEAEVHPQRSVITRALGTDPDVDVDAFAVEAQPGDVFLLCSDGLSTWSTRDGIARARPAEPRRPRRQATRALVAAANRGGGDDNITAVLFERRRATPQRATRGLDGVTREHVPSRSTPTRRTRCIRRTRSPDAPPAPRLARATTVVDARRDLASRREAAASRARARAEPEPEPRADSRPDLAPAARAARRSWRLIALIVVLVVSGSPR